MEKIFELTLSKDENTNEAALTCEFKRDTDKREIIALMSIALETGLYMGDKKGKELVEILMSICKTIEANAGIEGSTSVHYYKGKNTKGGN